MNTTLFANTWREKLASPMSVVVLALFSLALPIVAGLMKGHIPQASALEGALVLTLFIAAGAIGRDVSSGSLPLIFSRPLRRSEYVVARWLGVATLAAACALIALGAQAGALTIRHEHTTWTHLWQNGVERIAFTFTLTAVLVALSALVPKSWNIGLYAAIALPLQLLTEVPWAPGKAVATRVLPLFFPDVNAWKTFSATPVSWFAVVSVFSTLTLAITFATWWMNRKELSYASG
jgi:ABC-2 type transport system permease protein